MKTDRKNNTLSNNIKVSAQYDQLYNDKHAKLLIWLPIFTVIVTIITSAIKHTPAVDIAGQAVITAILTTALTYYIRLCTESYLMNKYTTVIIISNYLISILLLLAVPRPEVLSFWMLGGLVISMIIDNKLGLLMQFNMAFIMGITLNVEPKMILQNLVVCILMLMLTDALKNKATILYGAVIILSLDISLAFVINCFVFKKVIGAGYYATSFFSILAVIITAFFIYVQYQKIMERKLEADCKNQVFNNIITSEETDAERNSGEASANINTVPELSSEQNTAIPKDSQAEQMVSTEQDSHAEQMVSMEQESQEKQKVSVQQNTQSEQSIDINQDAKAEQCILDAPAAVTNSDEVNNKYHSNINSTSFEVLCNMDNILLKQLREFSDSLYEHSLKIGDLSGRAAREIGADEMLARAGGFYHEIGKLNGKQYIEEGIKIAAEYAFPQELVSILKGHNIKYDKPSSVEAAIVMLSDNLVSTIEYIERTGDHKFTTEKIIDNVFQMRMDKGTFDSSGIFLKDFKTLKAFYQREFSKDNEEQVE